MKKLRDTIPGIILTFIIAIPAWIIGGVFPIIGSPILGILLGLAFAHWRRPVALECGISYTSKKILQYSIILLGFSMDLFHIFKVGSQTMVLMIFTLSVTLLTAYIAGKLLKIDRNTNILIGVGTAICGGSAIAATAPIIQSNDEEVAQAISTIFLFNVLAAFLFPFIGQLLHMTDYHFGLWAGTAINDTSSVVAAGYTFSNTAGNLAVIVKLTRTLMIIPITLVLAFYIYRKGANTGMANYNLVRIFPWFILGFIAAAIMNTFLPLPLEMGNFLVQTGKFMIVMAMAAIGLNTNIIKLAKSGWKPIALGFLCWTILSITSLIVQYVV